MIRSMTGFARAESQHAFGVLACELKTVNHRYLEMGFKLPEELRSIETRLRELATAGLRRGKLDCSFRFQAATQGPESVQVDDAMVTALLAACAKIEDVMTNPARAHAIDILRWPGVVRTTDRDVTPMQEAAITLFGRTLEALQQQRAAEGERIKQMLQSRATQMSVLVARLHDRSPRILEGLREKLSQRIANLGVQAEPGRLEQELAYVAQRLDVTEELDRLGSHLTSMASSLEEKDPVGRKLDFLMQEFNREANTLGSKSADLETTQVSVEMKVLIEQMREQIQNIE